MDQSQNQRPATSTTTPSRSFQFHPLRVPIFDLFNLYLGLGVFSLSLSLSFLLFFFLLLHSHFFFSFHFSISETVARNPMTHFATNRKCSLTAFFFFKKKKLFIQIEEITNCFTVICFYYYPNAVIGFFRYCNVGILFILQNKLS